MIDANGKNTYAVAVRLCAPTNPDIDWIPLSIPEFRLEARDLTDEDVSKIVSLAHLFQLQ